MKKYSTILFSVFFLLGCWAYCFSCSAAYMVTAEELTALEATFNELRKVNDEQKKILSTQNSQLMQLKFDLDEALYALNSSRKDLTEQKRLLDEANLSLQKFAAEEKSKRLRIKRQRNLYFCIALGVTLGRVIHK